MGAHSLAAPSHGAVFSEEGGELSHVWELHGTSREGLPGLGHLLSPRQQPAAHTVPRLNGYRGRSVT